MFSIPDPELREHIYRACSGGRSLQQGSGVKRALDCESDLTDVCIMTGMNGPLNGEKRLARERGLVAGRQLALGNTALMQTDQVSVESVANEADSMRAQGASVMYLSGDGRLAGLLAVADPIKATTPEALATLKENGIRVVMATGDGVVTAKAVAERLGIDEYHGEVKPADKLDLVTKLQQARHVVAMAGDGINDAPALAKADVGVAMGTGTDVAMSSAQVTLVKGDLRGIARARELSEATVANMKQNLGFAFVYNALGVPLAAGVLYPFTGLLLSPMIAALAMSLSSASVISNALRLRNTKI